MASVISAAALESRIHHLRDWKSQVSACLVNHLRERITELSRQLEIILLDSLRRLGTQDEEVR
jgi:hypothetical protein